MAVLDAASDAPALGELVRPKAESRHATTHDDDGEHDVVCAASPRRRTRPFDGCVGVFDYRSSLGYGTRLGRAGRMLQ